MKLFTILVFAMASFFIVGLLDARYKIEVKVEGGLKRDGPKLKPNAALKGNYFQLGLLAAYVV